MKQMLLTTTLIALPVEAFSLFHVYASTLAAPVANDDNRAGEGVAQGLSLMRRSAHP